MPQCPERYKTQWKSSERAERDGNTQSSRSRGLYPHLDCELDLCIKVVLHLLAKQLRLAPLGAFSVLVLKVSAAETGLEQLRRVVKAP